MKRPRHDPIACTTPITFFRCPAGQIRVQRILVHMFIIYFYDLQTQTAGRRALLCRTEAVSQGLFE
jgi:hypothetical protein